MWRPRPPSSEDVLFFAGLGLIGWGVWQFSPAVAGVVVGALLVLFVVPAGRWLR